MLKRAKTCANQGAHFLDGVWGDVSHGFFYDTAKRGQRLLTPMESDEELVHALVKKGIKSADELATTLHCKPDGFAAAKGEAYVHELIEVALSTEEDLKALEAEEGDTKKVESVNAAGDALWETWEAYSDRLKRIFPEIVWGESTPAEPT